MDFWSLLNKSGFEVTPKDILRKELDEVMDKYDIPVWDEATKFGFASDMEAAIGRYYVAGGKLNDQYGKVIEEAKDVEIVVSVKVAEDEMPEISYDLRRRMKSS